VPSLLKTLGWLLLVPAGVLVIMFPIALIDGAWEAVPGLIMFVGLLGVPGFLLRRAGLEGQRVSELQTQMVAYVRTHDAFSINELAAHIGKTPAEAQLLLDRDIARYHLPLVMHRASGRYLRLDRISRAAQVAERCQSCGASIGCQIVFEGERLTCPYCSSVVQTHAPAPPSWPGAQGHVHAHGHANAHAPNPWGQW
jgi:hypothetical protein